MRKICQHFLGRNGFQMLNAIVLDCELYVDDEGFNTVGKRLFRSISLGGMIKREAAGNPLALIFENHPLEQDRLVFRTCHSTVPLILEYPEHTNKQSADYNIGRVT